MDDDDFLVFQDRLAIGTGLPDLRPCARCLMHRYMHSWTDEGYKCLTCPGFFLPVEQLPPSAE